MTFGQKRTMKIISYFSIIDSESGTSGEEEIAKLDIVLEIR